MIKNLFERQKFKVIQNYFNKSEQNSRTMAANNQGITSKIKYETLKECQRI